MGINPAATITLIAPAFYPSEYAIRYFAGSAKRLGVDVRLYGLGEPYINWVDTHITQCRAVLDTIETSHVLFTDASDVMFLRDTAEIARRYESLWRPRILMGIEHDGGLNAGGYIAEVGYLKQVLQQLAPLQSGDPQERWRELVGNGAIDVTRDWGSAIFHVVHRTPPDLNRGCLLHFAGGYTDHEVGKFDQMESTWRTLESTENTER